MPLNVDGTGSGTLVASLLTFTMSFQLGEVTEVTFDGESLLGKKSNLSLSSSKSHDLVFICE